MASIYANFDSNFNNSNAYEYEAFYNDELEIPPNSEVSLYLASIERAPIYLYNNEKITIDLTPSLTDRLSANSFCRDNANITTQISIDLDSGGYSKQEFLETIQEKFQDAIAENNGDNDVNATTDNFRYDLRVENGLNSIFMGVVPDFERKNPAIPYELGNMETDFTQKNMNFSTNIGGVTFSNAIANSTDDFLSYSMVASPVYNLSMNREPTNHTRSQSSMFWSFGQLDESKSGAQPTRYCCGFILPKLFSEQNSSTVGNKLLTQDLINDVEFTNMPVCQIGIYYENGDANQEQKICIYQNSSLSDNNKTGRETINRMVKVASYNLAKITADVDDPATRKNCFGIQFYCENDRSIFDISENTYYYRVYNYGARDIYNGNEPNCIYDSKDSGHRIGQRLVQSCFEQDTNNKINDRTYMQGLVPFFAIGQVDDISDANISDVKGNFILQKNFGSTRLANNPSGRRLIGNTTYKLNVSTGLIDIFGRENSYYNPNGYPSTNLNPNFGVTALFINDRPYNIEIENLPIKSYNNTANLSIGTRRAILYQLCDIFRAPLNKVNQNLLTRAKYIDQMKFLKLNNKEAIKINKLNIRITYCDTNQLAKEITDARIEIILRQHK